MKLNAFIAFSALISISGLSFSQEPPSTDSEIINDPHFREEHGLNTYTRPSIEEVFDQLSKLAPLPLTEVPFQQQKNMPEEREELAIEIGFLISEGFLAVQSGDMKKVQTLASTLSRYSNALGAGEKVKGHAAAILELSKNNEIDKLKSELSATQEDVEKELILLQDIDLAHLISLGGWLRALDVSTSAVRKNFSEGRAKLLYREDVADYYAYALSSMKPELKEKANVQQMLKDLNALKKIMLLEKGVHPNKPDIEIMKKLTTSLVTQALTRSE